MSLFISMYKGILCGMRRVRGTDDNWNAYVAGMVAGLSILFDRNRTRRVMIALYLSTRTVHFACRWLWRHYVSKSVSEWTADKSDDVPVQVVQPGKGIITRSGSPFRQNNLSVSSSTGLGLKQTELFQPAEVALPIEPENSIALDHKHPIRQFIRHTSGLIVVMLSSAQMLNAYILGPDTLNVTYQLT